jgi:hypothetical protein
MKKGEKVKADEPEILRYIGDESYGEDDLPC